MAEKRDILWRFLGDAKGLGRASKDAQKSLGGVQRGMGNLGKAAAGLGVAFGASEVLSFARDATAAATSAEEAASKFQAVFGTGGGAASAMEEFADKAGVATAKSQDLFGTLGNLIQNAGVTREAAVDLTAEVGTLAGDLASFNDQDPEQVFEDLAFAITTTERDALKKYGITISETEVKQRALNIALEDGRDEATKTDRIMASLELATEGAGGAVGDLDRTADGAANRLRRLNARMEDLTVQIGKKLLPLQDDLLDIAEALVIVGDEGATAGEKIVAAGEAIGGIEGALGTIAVGWDELGDGISWALDQAERVPLAGGLIEWARAVNDEVTGANAAVEENNERMAILIEQAPKAFSAELRRRVELYKEQVGGVAGELSTTAGFLRDLPMLWTNAFPEGAEVRRAAGAVGRRREQVGAAYNPPDVVNVPGINRQSGGVVPGRRGQPVPIIAHGGEHFSGNASGGGDGVVMNFNFNGVVGDPDAVAAQIADLFTRYQQTNAIPIDGLSSF